MKLKMKEIREARGMSQNELAEAIGATRSKVGAWERGTTNIPLDVACDIARALGVTIDQLAGMEQMPIIPRTAYELIELEDGSVTFRPIR